jgi:hypothetical protein
MIDQNLCGMTSPEFWAPEEIYEGFEAGGCLGPKRNGFEVVACKGCQFYPKLKIISLKLDKI